MARAVIPSLQRLVFYLIITLILTVAVLYLFNHFIEPTSVSFSTILAESVNIIIIVSSSLAAIAIARRFRSFIAQKMGGQASTIIYYITFTIIILFMTFGILDTLGTRTTDLLTGAGIISITAGLVISTFVGSILSGALVFTNYKFRIGDSVVVNSTPGKIIEMNVLVMRIQTDIGQITVPNSAISSGGVIITVIRESDMSKESRLSYSVGDRVVTSYMNEQGVVKELTPFHTIVQLDSGKEVHYLNSSILSGTVVIAKISPASDQSKNKAA